MSAARFGPTATLLSTGKVLIAGGGSTPNVGSGLASADLYDPVTNTFSTSQSTMSELRESATATLLPGGNVLIAGGFAPTLGVLSDADLYHPTTNMFTPSASLMSDFRCAATATLLPSGRVLIAGGDDGDNANSGGATSPTSTADLYVPGTDTFTTSNGTLSDSREYAAAVLLPSRKVLIVGGDDGNGPTNSADLYDPVEDSFKASGSTMSDSREYATATLLSNGKVLIAGGLDANGDIVASADLYTP